MGEKTEANPPPRSHSRQAAKPGLESRQLVQGQVLSLCLLRMVPGHTLSPCCSHAGQVSCPEPEPSLGMEDFHSTHLGARQPDPLLCKVPVSSHFLKRGSFP